MAITVPPIGVVVTKWQTRASGASNDYKIGVQGAGGAWQTGVDGAEQNWSTGVSTASANHFYSRGVNGKQAVYVDRSVNIGAGRYGGGIQAAVNQYTTGMGKVLAVIAGVTLPPKLATGSNNARVTAVTDALHQAKLSGQL